MSARSQCAMICALAPLLLTLALPCRAETGKLQVGSKARVSIGDAPVQDDAGNVLAKLPAGAEVTIAGVEGRRAKITYLWAGLSKQGWVDGLYLAPIGNDRGAGSVETGTKTGPNKEPEPSITKDVAQPLRKKPGQVEVDGDSIVVSYWGRGPGIAGGDNFRAVDALLKAGFTVYLSQATLREEAGDWTELLDRKLRNVSTPEDKVRTAMGEQALKFAGYLNASARACSFVGSHLGAFVDRHRESDGYKSWKDGNEPWRWGWWGPWSCYLMDGTRKAPQARIKVAPPLPHSMPILYLGFSEDSKEYALVPLQDHGTPIFLFHRELCLLDPGRNCLLHTTIFANFPSELPAKGDYSGDMRYKRLLATIARSHEAPKMPVTRDQGEGTRDGSVAVPGTELVVDLRSQVTIKRSRTEVIESCRSRMDAQTCELEAMTIREILGDGFKLRLARSFLEAKARTLRGGLHAGGGTRTMYPLLAGYLESALGAGDLYGAHLETLRRSSFRGEFWLSLRAVPPWYEGLLSARSWTAEKVQVAPLDAGAMPILRVTFKWSLPFPDPVKGAIGFAGAVPSVDLSLLVSRKVICHRSVVPRLDTYPPHAVALWTDRFVSELRNLQPTPSPRN